MTSRDGPRLSLSPSSALLLLMMMAVTTTATALAGCRGFQYQPCESMLSFSRLSFSRLSFSRSTRLTGRSVARPIAAFRPPLPLNLRATNTNDGESPEKQAQEGSRKIWEPDGEAEGTADVLRGTLRKLAQLSLQDYEWRSGVFKSNEADRLVEESIARMRGEDPAYVRPMDAPSESDDGMPAGPLGKWEKSSVQWLRMVFDEEGRRARKIVSADGRLVRPMFASDGDENGEDGLGPLGRIEKAVVEFIQSILNSERERVRVRAVRPMDVVVVAKSDGGGSQEKVEVESPLGKLERDAVRILDEIRESERLRAQQSKTRGGEIIRPIDVPGPLGELEMAVSELFQAEKRRSIESARARASKDGDGAGKKKIIVRPKDARYRGPLGEAEQLAYETIRQLNAEELERLRSIQRVMRDNRPMDVAADSFLGWLERFLVGIFRAPQMLSSVFDRVRELLESESLLTEADRKKILGDASNFGDSATTRKNSGPDDDQRRKGSPGMG